MRRFLRRRRLRLVPLALAALVVAPAASAAVRIQSVDTSSFPAVRLTVVAPLNAVTPRLTENAAPVAGYSAVNLGGQKAIVLALDRSQSMLGRPFANALSAARTFVGSAGPHDHVGIVAFGHSAFGLGRFSAPPSDARTSLGGLSVDNKSGTALYDAIYFACRDKLQQDQPRHKFRRAIVLLSDGEDNQSRYTRDQALEMAQKADVVLYAISTNISHIESDGDKILKYFTAETGGRAFFPFKVEDMGQDFTDIHNELRHQYNVSYRPEPLLTDGLFHTIEMRVKGHKEYIVHARKGYYARKM